MAVVGKARFRRHMRRAVPDAIRAAAVAALEAEAAKIVASMKARAPKLSGDLAESIGWTWGAAPAGAMVVGTVAARAGDAARITIYAGGGDAFYARFQEFGTVKMPASPFFYPTWRAERRRARSAITRRITKAIRAL